MYRFVSTGGTPIFQEFPNIYPTGFMCHVYFAWYQIQTTTLFHISLMRLYQTMRLYPRDIQPRQLIFDHLVRLERAAFAEETIVLSTTSRQNFRRDMC